MKANIIIHLTLLFLFASCTQNTPDVSNQLVKNSVVRAEYIAQYAVDSKNQQLIQEPIKDIGQFTKQIEIRENLNKVTSLEEAERFCEKYGYKIEKVSSKIANSSFFKTIQKNGTKIVNIRKPKEAIMLGIVAIGGIYHYYYEEQNKKDLNAKITHIDSIETQLKFLIENIAK
jgi:hypothetical protein